MAENKWVTGVIVIAVLAPIGGVVFLLITGRGQPFRGPISKTANGFTKTEKNYLFLV